VNLDAGRRRGDAGDWKPHRDLAAAPASFRLAAGEPLSGAVGLDSGMRQALISNQTPAISQQV